MEAVAYSNVRNNLKSYLKKVNEDSEPVYIISQNSEDNAVLISQSDYENMLENAYIRKSQANVDFLLAGYEAMRSGEGKEHDWE